MYPNSFSMTDTSGVQWPDEEKEVVEGVVVVVIGVGVGIVVVAGLENSGASLLLVAVLFSADNEGRMDRAMAMASISAEGGGCAE